MNAILMNDTLLIRLPAEEGELYSLFILASMVRHDEDLWYITCHMGLAGETLMVNYAQEHATTNDPAAAARSIALGKAHEGMWLLREMRRLWGEGYGRIGDYAYYHLSPLLRDEPKVLDGAVLKTGRFPQPFPSSHIGLSIELLHVASPGEDWTETWPRMALFTPTGPMGRIGNACIRQVLETPRTGGGARAMKPDRMFNDLYDSCLFLLSWMEMEWRRRGAQYPQGLEGERWEYDGWGALHPHPFYRDGPAVGNHGVVRCEEVMAMLASERLFGINAPEYRLLWEE